MHSSYHSAPPILDRSVAPTLGYVNAGLDGRLLYPPLPSRGLMNRRDLEGAFKVAAVQTSPCFLDVRRTVAKACHFIREAATHGASIVAFPEAFVPAYPYWTWLESPLESQRHFHTLYRNSITIPSEWTDVLARCAKENNIITVIGVNEVDPLLTGTIVNTNLILDNHGTIF